MSSIDWDSIDWVKGDSAIAKELGLTRQRVHQVRQERGEGSPERKTDYIVRTLRGMDTEHMGFKEIKDCLGVSVSENHLYRLMMEHGIPYVTYKTPLNAWLANNDSSQYTIKEISMQAGVGQNNVRSFLNANGLTFKPAPPQGFRNRIPWELVTDWSAPAKEIAALVGTTDSAVYNKRSKMRRDGKL